MDVHWAEEDIFYYSIEESGQQDDWNEKEDGQVYVVDRISSSWAPEFEQAVETYTETAERWNYYTSYQISLFYHNCLCYAIMSQE